MRHVTHNMAKGKQGSALWGRGRAEPSGPQQEREEPSSTAGGQNQGPKYQIKAPSRPRKHLRVGYLLVAAPAGCLVGGELLLHMGGLVHLLGVKGQAAQRAQRGWHLQAWLEALPAEPAGGRGQGAWAPAHMGQQLSAANCVFLETLTSEPKSHWLDGLKGSLPAVGSWDALPYLGARQSCSFASIGPVLAPRPWSQQEFWLQKEAGAQPYSLTTTQ